MSYRKLKNPQTCPKQNSFSSPLLSFHLYRFLYFQITNLMLIFPLPLAYNYLVLSILLRKYFQSPSFPLSYMPQSKPSFPSQAITAASFSTFSFLIVADQICSATRAVIPKHKPGLITCHWKIPRICYTISKIKSTFLFTQQSLS